VFVHMSLSGLAGVFLGVPVMALRRVGVVSRLLMISRLMMLGGGIMMLCGVLVVFGSFTMVLRSFLRHECSPVKSRSQLTSLRCTNQHAHGL
jgi:hypothetical protein